MNVVHPSFVCAHFICSNVNGLLSLKKINFFFFDELILSLNCGPRVHLRLFCLVPLQIGSVHDLSHQVILAIWSVNFATAYGRFFFFFLILSNCRQRIKCLGMFNRITIVTVFIHGAIKKKNPWWGQQEPGEHSVFLKGRPTFLECLRKLKGH